MIALLLKATLVSAVRADEASKIIPPVPDAMITVFDGPVLADGRIDYLTALKNHLKQGDDPAKNAYRALYLISDRDFPPDDPFNQAALHMSIGAKLGVDQRELERSPYFVDWFKFAKDNGLSQEAAREIEGDAYEGEFDHANAELFGKWIAANGPAYDALIEAVTLPGYWRPLVESPRQPGSGLFVASGLGQMRAFARALDYRVKWALHTQQPQLATRDLIAMSRLAVQSARGGMLMDYLVAISIDAMAVDTLHGYLASRQYDADQLGRLADAWQNRPRRVSLAEVMDVTSRADLFNGFFAPLSGRVSIGDVLFGFGDTRQLEGEIRLLGLDYNRAAIRLSRHLDGQSPSFQAATYAEFALHQQAWERDIEPKFEKLDDKYITENEEGEDRIDLGLQRFSRQSLTDLTADLYFAQVASSRFAVPRTLFSLQARRAVGLAAIACERYRLENGRFPARLQALVPEYLPDIPIDPIDGRPLRYRVEDDGGATIYSIFTNQQDDGGTTDFEDWSAVREGDYVWKLKAPSQ